MSGDGRFPTDALPPDGQPAGIRRASLADVSAIAAFQTECWREAYRGLVDQTYLDRVGVEQRERRWLRRLTRATREVVLAELEAQVVGVVSWRDRPGGELPALELASLYVAAPCRGTGVAAALLHCAIGEAPAYLWVFTGNARAGSFYRKHRFRFDGTTAVDPDTQLQEQRFVRR